MPDNEILNVLQAYEDVRIHVHPEDAIPYCLNRTILDESEIRKIISDYCDNLKKFNGSIVFALAETIRLYNS